MSLGSAAFKWIRRFSRDRRASVAITFTFTVMPVLVLMSGAVDYGRALKTKSKLQTALDSASMMALSSTTASTENFLANATALNLTLSGNPTYVTNSDGSITATASASLATGLLSLIGVSSIPLSVSSTAAWTHPLTPQSITYQFQYAKGWYYKVVTLYVQQSSTSATLPLATWTYQVKNNTMVAIPLNQAAVPYFWSGSTLPTDTGVGIVTTAWNATNATTIGATLDAANNKITFNNTYYNLYLTMNVADQMCPLGQASYTTNTTPSTSDQNFFNSVYGSANVTTENVGCRSPIKGDSTPLSNWSMTVSTNSSSNSNYLYINGVEQPANAAIGLSGAFPCPASVAASTPVTNNYEWEDSNNSTSGTRDFFFSLTTTCTTNQWSNAPSIPKLIR